MAQPVGKRTTPVTLSFANTHVEFETFCNELKAYYPRSSLLSYVNIAISRLQEEGSFNSIVREKFLTPQMQSKIERKVIEIKLNEETSQKIISTEQHEPLIPIIKSTPLERATITYLPHATKSDKRRFFMILIALFAVSFFYDFLNPPKYPFRG